jgi:hypothetical protein
MKSDARLQFKGIVTAPMLPRLKRLGYPQRRATGLAAS